MHIEYSRKHISIHGQLQANKQKVTLHVTLLAFFLPLTFPQIPPRSQSGHSFVGAAVGGAAATATKRVAK